jgi:hypothetical protein
MSDFRIFHVSAGGSLTLHRLNIEGGNSADSALGGGGILNEGTLVLDETVVVDNSATGGSSPGGDGSGGGGVTNLGKATLINSTINGNRSTSSGGGIENTGMLTIINTPVTSNMANFDGGGIENSGTATIIGSFIGDSNTAGRFGGGINNFLGPASPATLALSNSSIIGNRANLDGGGFENSAIATLTNSTISGNIAGHLGSGIGNFATLSIAGTLTVNNVTLTRNSGPSGVSGFFNQPGSIINISNTIVAQNSGRDCEGAFNSRGFNLVGVVDSQNCSGFGAQGDKVGTSSNPIDAMLGPLQNNGRGPHSLLSTSSAIDTGNPAEPGSGGNACQLSDQQGNLRPVDGPDPDSVATCDIGAFEFGASPQQIKIPIRWCYVEGSPSFTNPAMVGESSIDNVLLRRLTRVNENIYSFQTNLLFRPGVRPQNPNPNFIMIEDPKAIGELGDVLFGSDEFALLVNDCRKKWTDNDKTVTGITAVHINRFVDNNGAPLNFVGFGGIARFTVAEQMVSGYVVAIDNAYTLPKSTLLKRPNDILPRNDPIDLGALAHEFGHALSLEHGNGLDDNNSMGFDEPGEEDDPIVGPNLMQYADGRTITPGQSNQIRTQALERIPDRVVDPVTPPLANAGVDTLGDIPAGEAFVDINDLGVAIDQKTSTTTFFSSTTGLFPRNISDLNYLYPGGFG